MYPMCRYLEANLLCKPKKSLKRLLTENSSLLKMDRLVYKHTHREMNTHVYSYMNFTVKDCVSLTFVLTL